MRTIKFRGRCVEEFHTHHEQTEPGQWIYGYLIDEKTISHRMSEEHGGMGPGIITVHIEVDPETVGQLIPFRDLEEQTMYDGDIINCEILEGGRVHGSDVFYRNCKIEWDDLFAGIWIDGYFKPLHKVIFLDFEKVGNVHDNPELI